MSIYNIKKNDDLSFGFSKEKSILPIIKNKFGNDIEPHPDKFSLYDFSDNDTLIELKSRHIRHNQYPTALIGKNKLDYFKTEIKNGMKVYLVYCYTDGIFFVEYTGQNKWESNSFCRKGRGKIEKSLVYHIPYQELNKIEN